MPDGVKCSGETTEQVSIGMVKQEDDGIFSSAGRQTEGDTMKV